MEEHLLPNVARLSIAALFALSAKANRVADRGKPRKTFRVREFELAGYRYETPARSTNLMTFVSLESFHATDSHIRDVGTGNGYIQFRERVLSPS